MSAIIKRNVERIPKKIRELIVEQDLINKAVHTTEQEGTPMHFLYDVFEEFLDPPGEWSNWFCPKCRAYILSQWKNMQPYLTEA